MTRGALDRERRIAAALQLAIYILLAGALAAFLVVYFRFRPRTELSPWLAYGFPIAICIAILHFGRRAILSWRRLRNR